jgi:hypothetical protein
MTNSIIQILSMLLSVITLFIFYYWTRKRPEIKFYLIPVVSWLLHVVIFYLTREVFSYFDIGYEGLLFTNWSSFVRLHAVFSVFYASLILSGIVEDSWRKLWTTFYKHWKKL